MMDAEHSRPADPAVSRLHSLQAVQPYRSHGVTPRQQKQLERLYRKWLLRIDKVHSEFEERQQLTLTHLINPGNELVSCAIQHHDLLCYLVRREPHAHPVWQYSIRVATWALLIGRELQLKPAILNDIFQAGVLSKAGYLTLPKVMFSNEGTRSQQEEEMLKTTLIKGVRLIQGNNGISGNLIRMLSYHLERLDGSGYPRRVAHPHVPLLAQIVGLADYYESLTSYAFRDEPVAALDALQELYRSRDRLFDRRLVDALLRVLGPYPAGSIVKLSDHRIAMVYAQQAHTRLFPLVIPWPVEQDAEPALWETPLDLAACRGEPRIVASLPPLPRRASPRQAAFFSSAAQMDRHPYRRAAAAHK